MGGDGRLQRPGASADAGPEAVQEDPAQLTRGDADRSWPLTDPMRYVRQDRQLAALRIDRSMKAWRKAAAGGRGGGVAIPSGGGVALDGGVRGRMEAQLGADLGSARIHTSADSARAAEG